MKTHITSDGRVLDHNTYCREYYQQNKEKLKAECRANNRIYYENNREKILQRHREDIMCDVCNFTVKRRNMNAHNKTARHLRNQSLQNNGTEAES